MDSFENEVYSKSVLEFVTVANEFCVFVEQADRLTIADFIDKTHKVLPFLYLKATMLPILDSSYEDFNETFVTEHDYDSLHAMLIRKMGKYNFYQEVIDPLRQENDEPLEASIAENIADIYQDLKNFTLLYQVGTNEVMYNAVWECRQVFEQYWGQRLVNVLRALHNLKYNVVDLVEEDDEMPAPGCETDFDDVDTSNWFITRRQEDLRNEE